MRRKTTGLVTILIAVVMTSGNPLFTRFSIASTNPAHAEDKDKHKDKDKKKESEQKDKDKKDKDKKDKKNTDSGASAESQREIGRRLLRRGEAGEALIYLENARRQYSQNGGKDKLGLAATEDLIGQLFEQQSRYDQALEHYQAALSIYSGLKKSAEYNTNLMLAKIGNVHYRQGDAEGARSAYQRMQVKKPGSKAKSLIPIIGGIAASQASDDRSIEIGAPAAGTALSAKEIFDRYRRTIVFAGYEIGLGRVDYSAGDFKNAREHFEDALKATKDNLPGIGKLGQTRRFRSVARTSLGDVALKQGNTKEAIDYYEDAAKEARKEKRLELMWPAERGLGRSLWLQATEERDPKKKASLRADSIAAYTRALESIENLRSGGIRSDDARTTFIATTRQVFDEASSALAEMALMLGGSNTARALEGPAFDYAAKSFEVVERSRARSLLDLLRETGTNIREGIAPELYKRKQENLDQQSMVAQLLLGVNLTDKALNIEGLEKRANELQDEEVSIENEIRNNSPRYHDLTSTQPITLTQVRQRLLDDNTVLIEYNLTQEVSYCFAISRREVRLFKLAPRGDIDAQVDELRRLILPPDAGRSILELTSDDVQRGLSIRKQHDSGASVAVFVNASNRLYKTVLEPAQDTIGSRALLIVPDGSLSFVPFEALVTSSGGDNYSSLPYLAKTNETAYAPSASVVDTLRRQAGSNAGRSTSALLIADPIFSPGDERARNAPAGSTMATPRGLFVTNAVGDVSGTGKSLSSSFAIKRLPGTRDEANEIERVAKASGLNVTKWFDLDASEANTVERDLRSFGYLHIATHGMLDAKHPQFSGLVLSLIANKDGRDGFLRTDEVFNLRLGHPLVMLSACQTGLGKERLGEGVMGLTRAFMYAGAPMVGVTLWSVDDKPTADLMSDFYRTMFASSAGTPAASLRAARLNMIANKKFSAPFYWASFVLVGDWR